MRPIQCRSLLESNLTLGKNLHEVAGLPYAVAIKEIDNVTLDLVRGQQLVSTGIDWGAGRHHSRTPKFVSDVWSRVPIVRPSNAKPHRSPFGRESESRVASFRRR